MARRCIAVAYSGGRDSTALLHATLLAAQEHGVSVAALHVHHGLSTNADAWLAHGERRCRAWARRGLPIVFVSRRLGSRPAPGESIEAWARRERYRALREMALECGATAVLLAHHRRDQAETLLLQALRGAGTAGLAAMPAAQVRDGIAWLRPWLERSSEDIDAYMRRHRLRHIVDDTNADLRFARNRLRHEVWPALLHAFPDADITLGVTARWAAQATELLGEVAQDDLSGIETVGDELELAAWREWSPVRRANALRVWLRDRSNGIPVSAALTLRLLDELVRLRSARWPFGDGELRLHRGRLRYHPTAAVATKAPQASRESTLRVVRAGRYRLPGWGGELCVSRTAADGVPMAWLGRLELRERAGAERFQAGLGRPPRSLKKQFQAAGISAWDRDGPLIYSGGQLLYVPGLGLDARAIGLPGQALATLRWVPAQPV